ncbi:MAG TPA: RluA family pseudouridine synthase [Acidimicrobiales bacterium]|nr:RluA family pseudouridine synthase [Acidimicrobiales bacterium]
MTVISLVVPASLDGVRVDKAVALVADLSRSAVDRLIGEGGVEVDGTAVTNRRVVLRLGQQLRVAPSPVRIRRPEGDPGVVFDVVYEDAEVIVVDKPAGLVVHPGAGHHHRTLVNGLLARYPELTLLSAEVGADEMRPGIVHRLDRGTSGLMVVARTPGAYSSLVAQLRERRVSRRYQALVIGRVDADEGVVDAPIGRSTSSPTRMAVARKGKEARTHYQVVRRFDHPADATLLDVLLDTGRTHQIRVHLSAIGHPVVGDDAYGRDRTLAGSTLTRPFLHAAALSFECPADGQVFSFESPLAADLRSQLDALRP